MPPPAAAPAATAVATIPAPSAALVRRPPTPPPPPPPPSDGDEEEEGMLRMSFMEHLEELRTRIIRSLGGFVVVFLATMIFAPEIWRVISAPATSALKQLGYKGDLVAITPMEQFSTIYVYAPLLVSIFVSSPWLLFQVWSFISPGLYKKEKRWAVPFIATTSLLFIAGGCFAYFIAFRYALVFLLGIGRDIHVTPFVSISEYFDLFVNVTLGVALVFELPVLIFFLTLLRIASPRFLMKHCRYAILAIVIIAAIVTPTPDAFNMMLFAVPMVALFFVGVFASYLLVLKREGRKFPWRRIWLITFGSLALLAGFAAVMIYHYHFHVVRHWPYLTK
jgi:sec-independent protein translocase protein TatC